MTDLTERAKALLDAATPAIGGPKRWEFFTERNDGYVTECTIYANGTGERNEDGEPGAYDLVATAYDLFTAEFITAAPTLVAGLLAELAALRSQVTELQARTTPRLESVVREAFIRGFENGALSEGLQRIRDAERRAAIDARNIVLGAASPVTEGNAE